MSHFCIKLVISGGREEMERRNEMRERERERGEGVVLCVNISSTQLSGRDEGTKNSNSIKNSQFRPLMVSQYRQAMTQGSQ